MGPGGFEGGTTTRTYIGLIKNSRATAGRDLAELVGAGVSAQSTKAR